MSQSVPLRVEACGVKRKEFLVLDGLLKRGRKEEDRGSIGCLLRSSELLEIPLRDAAFHVRDIETGLSQLHRSRQASVSRLAVADDLFALRFFKIIHAASEMMERNVD